MLDPDKVSCINDTRYCPKHDQTAKEISLLVVNAYLQLEYRHKVFFSKLFGQVISSCCNQNISIVVEKTKYKESSKECALVLSKDLILKHEVSEFDDIPKFSLEVCFQCL